MVKGRKCALYLSATLIYHNLQAFLAAKRWEGVWISASQNPQLGNPAVGRVMPLKQICKSVDVTEHFGTAGR